MVRRVTIYIKQILVICKFIALPTELSKPHESSHIRVSPGYMGTFRLGPSTVEMKAILPIVAYE